MDLSSLIKSSLNEISTEFKKKENQDLIKNDLLNPVIEHVIEQLYPYFIKILIFIILLIVIMMTGIFLNIRVIYKNSN